MKHDEKNPTRTPLPPPFEVGTRVRYLGRSKMWTETDGGARVTIIEPGIEVTISQARPGRRGTGRIVVIEGDEFTDATRDGYSVYTVNGRNGRCIWPADAAKWEVIS